MENPRHWRLQHQRYAMVGETCSHCEARIFPPREVCPHCGYGAGLKHHIEQTKEVFAIATMVVAPALVRQ